MLFDAFYKSLKSYVRKRRKKLLIKQHRKILSIPRNLDFFPTLSGTKIKATDSLSYYYLKIEIFDEECYRLNFRKSDEIYIIDAGANIGLATIYWKLNYPNAKIIAFEPAKRVFEALENNIKAFSFENITLINRAAYNEETEVEFNTDENIGGSINPQKNGRFKYKVNTCSLRPYISNNKIDILKIDIEGAELIVLRDIEIKLKFVENIFIEYHSFVHEKQSLPEILEILTRNEFRIYIKQGLMPKHPFVKVPINLGQDMQINIYGVKSPSFVFENAN